MAVRLFVSSWVQPAAFSSSFPCGSALLMVLWAPRLPSWHVQRTLRRSSLVIRMSLGESHTLWVILGLCGRFTWSSKMKHCCCLRCWVDAEQKMVHALNNDLCHKKRSLYFIRWFAIDVRLLERGLCSIWKEAMYQGLFNTSLCHRTAQHFYFQLKIWKGGREKGCWSWLGYKFFFSLFRVC